MSKPVDVDVKRDEAGVSSLSKCYLTLAERWGDDLKASQLNLQHYWGRCLLCILVRHVARASRVHVLKYERLTP